MSQNMKVVFLFQAGETTRRERFTPVAAFHGFESGFCFFTMTELSKEPPPCLPLIGLYSLASSLINPIRTK